MSKNVEKVALFSTCGLFDPVLGRLERGYNIVTQEQANEWLKSSENVREASPQEVAMAFGG